MIKSSGYDERGSGEVRIASEYLKGNLNTYRRGRENHIAMDLTK
jgi:hypothetical protein